MACAARHQDPADPNGSSQREWYGGCEISRVQEGSSEGLLSRIAESLRPRFSKKADVWVWRDDRLRPRWTRSREAISGTREAVLVRREPRRCGDTDLSPGHNDPCIGSD